MFDRCSIEFYRSSIAFAIDYRGFDEGWRSIGGALEEHWRTAGALQEGWRRIREGLDDNASIDFR